MPDNDDTALTVTEVLPPELAKTEEPSKPAEPPISTVHLVARNPQQMAAAQADLTAWLQNKLSVVGNDIREMEVARDEAKKHKWKTSSFNNALSKFRKQFEFYQKILEAVLAGYTLIPNFPIDVFAVRVTRGWSATEDQYGGIHKADYLAEQPDTLPIGQGDYKSPKPEGYHFTKQEKGSDDKPVTKWYFRSCQMADCEFPFAVARPEVMSATAEAMALKVFDQIGICHQQAGSGHRQRGKGDPIIIGQIVAKADKYGYIHKPVSFLIAWHLDMRTL